MVELLKTFEVFWCLRVIKDSLRILQAKGLWVDALVAEPREGFGF